MHIFVTVQSLPNPEERLRIEAASNSFTADEDKYIVNDFDLIALESALRLQEKGSVSRVSVLSLGTRLSALQRALAMGADDAFFFETAEPLTSWQTAAVFAGFLQTQSFDLLMLGKLGVNYESQELAQRIAVMLDIPCVHQIYEIDHVDGAWEARCEEEGAFPLFRFKGPAVVSCDLRLAEPRTPSLPKILRAKHKPLHHLSPTIPTFNNDLTHLSLNEKPRVCKHCHYVNEDELFSIIREHQKT